MRYLVLLALVGCTTNVGTGTIAGTIIGAGSGSLCASGGAWVGGAAGAIGGSLVGMILDGQDRKVMEKNSPRTVDRMERGEPLTINDIIKLSQNGVEDELMMLYMRDTRSSYHLSQIQIRRLQDSGVSQRVIDYMIQTQA